MSYDLVKTSKLLSWILRHKAMDLNLPVDDQGFIPVQSILAVPQVAEKGISLSDIERIVSSNDKQRFQLCLLYHTVVSDSVMCIRAVQGHSFALNDYSYLEDITSSIGYDVIVHGTYQKFWPAIKENGLSRMKRQHIHFAPGLPSDGEVISGMRQNCDIHIYIDIDKALADGFKFMKAPNNVILCPGNVEGILPTYYFSKVHSFRNHRNRKEFDVLEL